MFDWLTQYTGNGWHSNTWDKNKCARMGLQNTGPGDKTKLSWLIVTLILYIKCMFLIGWQSNTRPCAWLFDTLFTGPIQFSGIESIWILACTLYCTQHWSNNPFMMHTVKATQAFFYLIGFGLFWYFFVFRSNPGDFWP